MTQEDRKLLLKDLCARLPYNVIINCEGRDTKHKCFLTTDILNEILLNQEYYDYKPYLRPMSSMTEEEDKEWQTYKCSIAESCDRRLEERINALYDWFNSRYLDWRGLIPKGLALEAPEDMYKTE